MNEKQKEEEEKKMVAGRRKLCANCADPSREIQSVTKKKHSTFSFFYVVVRCSLFIIIIIFYSSFSFHSYSPSCSSTVQALPSLLFF